ncbi:MAG: phosphoribosylformylglycinamidine synthase subunit PurQ [SAR202 cluster bacterium]|nr:phosphoribosylformylglycinamidine synthase subunit PurQ [SAR202 cluster bacterium]MDP6300717.1 phosphoribosylformylglycinamidine synthase subunit PurQ [SAR202 cluster bacterium]MDP7103580.1 phosphoribosylformylglycinamidine synthase subunit PurQ [SAR202 cluster bacterium]MDP7223966.1 phosphoribosylformylglycinamidine synthase subunit PurQ [SAR202 cluster bacterium]MDP7412023.1 phosphoribosylformylglycinamidine synthase subunit PurQ [SAR202 cluster bacterium]
MNFGVVVFPGTWSDEDCHYAVSDVLGQQAQYVWHKDTDLSGIDCVIVPGGFSYGDYLRAGAIARFSPVMPAIEQFANDGGLVIGICNGFQILCEAGLLPGVLMRNEHLQFRCQWVNLRVENAETRFSALSAEGDVLQVPISHGEGNYHADDKVLRDLEANGQIVFRYSTEDGAITGEANPNGSMSNIAGVVNAGGNVLGMMPHPERCCEELVGGVDGAVIFRSIINSVTGSSATSGGSIAG